MHVARPRSKSREQLIESARVLLRRNGYRGTTLAQIVEGSGAPAGSVYFLFPKGKEQIAVEAVNAWAEEYEQMITAAFEATSGLPDWIHLMVGHFTTLLEATGFTEGLPITGITLESVPASEPLTEACRGAYDRWLDALAPGLVARGIPAADARDLGLFVISSLEGAITLCRAYQSIQPAVKAERHVLRILTEACHPDPER
jgi:TetR/AcrR family transcriptional repressor of lmrAB and yxaGH operons